jgi:nucleoside-diphosphate-sugar epimerase
MRVFVTGASGFVGSAVVKELIAAGHTVIGLVRSDAAAAALTASGAEAVRGSLDDTETLKREAAAADSVIHTAFNHDFSRFTESLEQDRRAIEVLGAALEGSNRPLLATSVIAFLADGRVAIESDIPPPASAVYLRASEAAVSAVATRGVRASVVRLPPAVHGDGDRGGLLPMLIGLARGKRASPYVGKGLNRWSAVHRIDAARLFRLAIEDGCASPHYRAVAEEGVAFRAIAEAIGRRLDVPVIGTTKEESAAHFGGLAPFAGMDVPSSSERTRSSLAWKPEQLDLLADLDRSTYFANDL